MRRSKLLRGIVGLAVVAGSGVAILTGSAGATTPNTLYVNNAAGCSDAASGTAAIPYCTIQAAANVVMPGQTVQITADPAGPVQSYGRFKLTRSGTAAEPITFVGVDASPLDTRKVDVLAEFVVDDSIAGVELSGVHDVKLSNIFSQYWGQQNGFAIVGSDHITLDSDSAQQAGGTVSTPPASVLIDGTSSYVTVSRTQVTQSFGYDLRVESGAHDITLTTNDLTGARSGAISVSGAARVAITSNTMMASCGGAIAVDGGTSATIENNVMEIQSCAAAPTSAAGIQVLADATATSDYNSVYAVATASEYVWGATRYATAAAFDAATGQGAHDIDQTKFFLGIPAEGSPLIDSADMSAPGELTTDINGRVRADDPRSANSGTGSSIADRGALERPDGITTTATATPLIGVAPLSSTLAIGAFTSSWSEPLTATVNFGDGSDPVTAVANSSIPHVYTLPGIYYEKTTIADTSGVTVSYYQTISAGTTTPPAANLTVGPFVYTANGTDDNVMGGSVTFGLPLGPNGWELSSRTIDFGDGSSMGLATTQTSWGHEYPAAGVYTVKLTDVDLLGRTTTSTVKAVVGDDYGVAWNWPIRDYDSRQVGKKVPAHGVLTLSLGDLNDTFSNVDALQLNVTVTDAKNSGYLTVYPSGAIPNASTLNFAAGQTVANGVRAMANSDGDVSFYNGSAGPIDLIIDTFGQDSRNDGAGTYVAVNPARVLDTRYGTGVTAGKIAGHGSVTVTIGGTHTVPNNAADAVVNIATTDTTSGGYLIAYGHGQPMPSTSTSNWAKGSTVSNLAVVPMSDGKIVLYNAGPGAVDFVVDLVGYYNLYGDASMYVPLSPYRLLDTRHGTGTGGKVAKIAAGATLKLQVTGADGVVAAGTKAAMLNLTATDATAGGWLVVYPDGTTQPSASALNYVSGQSVANMSIMQVGSDGAIDIFNGGNQAVDVIVDMNGTFFTYPAS